MFERFARAARTAVEDARYEAERRGDRRIGSDHLLLALLQDDEIARLVGADAGAAHDAADQLDRTALAAELNVSVNAWLVRAVTSAVSQPSRPSPQGGRGRPQAWIRRRGPSPA